MTYKVKSTTPLFRAHNSARQSAVTQGNRFSLADFYDCDAGSPSNSVLFTKAYVYGEIRTTGASSEQQNFDIGWDGGTVLTILSEGWQVRNNAQGTTCFDDGLYGVLEDEAAIKVKDSYTSQTGTSDIEETRIFGVRVR